MDMGVLGTRLYEYNWLLRFNTSVRFRTAKPPKDAGYVLEY